VIIMLDSHALVWWLNDDAGLSSSARGAIADPGNEVLVSAASVWELAIKRAAGKLELARDISADVESAGFGGIPITLADAEAAAALPRHHGDPFDRMLVVQAVRLDAVLMTRNRAFKAYDVRIFTA
jgi:PIN domain nuclease of toxin-antitoxin system